MLLNLFETKPLSFVTKPSPKPQSPFSLSPFEAKCAFRFKCSIDADCSQIKQSRFRIKSWATPPGIRTNPWTPIELARITLDRDRTTRNQGQPATVTVYSGAADFAQIRREAIAPLTLTQIEADQLVREVACDE